MSDLNYDEICSVVEEKLVPTFEMLGKMLREIDEKAEIGKRLADAFTEIVSGHKRGNVVSQIKEMFGGDLDVLDEYYKDNFDKSYSDELIESLMDNEGNITDIGAYAGSRINDAKGKYGKYLKFPNHEAEETPEEESVEEDNVEEMTPGEFYAMEGGGEEEEDPTGGMMKLLGLKGSSKGG